MNKLSHTDKLNLTKAAGGWSELFGAAGADPISLLLNAQTPGLGLAYKGIGQTIGGLTAAATPTRTRDEQIGAEGDMWKNLLLPGYAEHNLWKRLGHSMRGEGSTGKAYDLSQMKLGEGGAKQANLGRLAQNAALTTGGGIGTGLNALLEAARGDEDRVEGYVRGGLEGAGATAGALGGNILRHKIMNLLSPEGLKSIAGPGARNIAGPKTRAITKLLGILGLVGGGAYGGSKLGELAGDQETLRRLIPASAGAAGLGGATALGGGAVGGALGGPAGAALGALLGLGAGGTVGGLTGYGLEEEGNQLA
jgi:hypothetical protein